MLFGNSSRLFCAQLLSQICDKMMTVGLVWVFLERYSASVIPWFLGFSALPHLLFAWHSGKWTSAFGPLKTVIGTDFFRGIVFIALGLTWREIPLDAQLPILFIVSFIANVGGALFNPAILSLPVFLVESSKLQKLTALIDSCFSLGTILGPLASALLYPWFGLKGLFLFNGLSYIFAALLESGIRVPAPSPTSNDALTSSSPDPLGKILTKDTLLVSMLGGFLAINLFLAPITIFLPLFVKNNYHGTINTLAQLETSLGIGTVLGGIFLSSVQINSKTGTKIISGMILVAAAYLCFTVSGAPWVGCLFLALLGFFLTLVNVFSLNLFQMRPAPHNVPSVMSLVNLISVASLPFSMTVTGFLVASFDIRRLAITFGCILFLVVVGVSLNRELRAQ